MRVNQACDPISRTGLKAPAALARMVEKASPASALRREPQQEAATAQKSLPRIQVELVCQDETGSFDPNWDGPRLLPAFAAQVIGQAMPERRTTVMLETAYGSARVGRTALLLDRRS
jgi:hypothetical protein